MNQESKTDSNIKDKISISAIILGLLLSGLILMSYFTEEFETSQVLMYPLGLCFLVWFATRRNGCGSCNQISKK